MKLFVFNVSLILLNSLTAYCQTSKFIHTTFDNTLKKSEFILYLSKNFNSQSYQILKEKEPVDYIQWAPGSSHRQILTNYATVIHETCHLVNDDIGGILGRGFFISSQIKIKVSKTTVFKSSEIDKTIPDVWKNNIFRYSTYIQGLDPDENMASIKMESMA